MHARRGGGDGVDVLDALGGLEDGMHEDRLLDPVPGLELRQQLVDVVDVPRPLDLRQHDDVELVSDLGDDLDEVVERPGAVQRIDARPQPGGAERVRLRERDEAAPRRDLGVGRDRVLEVAEEHVDLRDQLRDLGAELVVVRRHEMDHPLEPHRQLAIGRRRAGGERLEEAARKLGHGISGLGADVPVLTAKPRLPSSPSS